VEDYVKKLLYEYKFTEANELIRKFKIKSFNVRDKVEKYVKK